MKVEVKIPVVGESITEGLLAEWLKTDGDVVAEEEPIMVIETDKITMTVNAEVAGRLAIQVEADSEVEIGQVVATIDTSAAAEAGAATSSSTVGVPAPVEEKAPEMNLEGLSPAVRKLVVENSLDPAAISGSGRGGRLLKEDVLHHLEAAAAPSPEPTPAPAPVVAPPVKSKPLPVAPVVERDPATRQTRTTMTRLRQRLAQRLVESQQNAAMLTTFNEVDMSRVMAMRSRYKEMFKDRHGVGLGFMSFFVKAVVDALKTVPEVNAFLEGNELVLNHYYDIGIAVSSEKGLVVPVVRDVDQRSMADVEREIANLASKARDRTLELSDLSGAVFTISNGGVFGSLMSTPILNPPQSAILGMHTIKKRPVVVDDEVVVRPMMYLAMSYDHRLIDGREAVTFLKRIVDCIENPERLLLEV